MQASDTNGRMGAVCSGVMSNPLTTKRDFVERVLPTARAQSTPWSAAGRVRANATTFALSRVGGQVRLGAGSDPRVTFEYKTGRVGAIILKRFIGGKVAATEMGGAIILRRYYRGKMAAGERGGDKEAAPWDPGE